MPKRSIFAKITCAVLLIEAAISLGLPGVALATLTTYYVSPSGNDSNTGTSPATAWKTINKVSNTTFQPGDKILFEGGQSFSGTLYLDSTDSSSAQLPITISSYGSSRATINGNSSHAISIYNSAGYNISNLNLIGSGAETNTGSGIDIYADLGGDVKLDYIAIDQVDIIGFHNGILIGAWNNLTGFKNVRITKVNAHHNRLVGIATYAQSFPANENVYVGYSNAYQNEGDPQSTTNSGSGITLGSVNSGTVEYSSAYNNGSLCQANECGVGIWTYDSTNITIQLNESYNNKTGSNVDGGGFDLDQNVSNSFLQYNYSHGNDGVGFLMAHDFSNQNHQNNTIRYNISQNDSRKHPGTAGILLWGSVRNAYIYNNTIYMIPNATGSPSAFTVANWAIENQDVFGIYVRNNIFQTTLGAPLAIVTADQLDGGTNIVFQQNDYFSTGSTFNIIWGNTTHNSLKNWRAAANQETNGGVATGLSSDPKLNNPGNGGTIGNPVDLPSLSAYKLQASSPLINQGLRLSNFGINPGLRDFFALAIPQGSAFDIGAHEFPAAPPKR